MSRYLEARDLLAATGDESAAWAIAQTDSGLLPGVTREQWLAFARENIARASERYEVRTTPRGFGVWDNDLKVWQTVKPTIEAAHEWIAAKIIEDRKPKSWRGIRMPLKD